MRDNAGVIMVNTFNAYSKRHFFSRVHRYKFYPTMYHFKAVDDYISYVIAAVIASIKKFMPS